MRWSTKAWDVAPSESYCLAKMCRRRKSKGAFERQVSQCLNLTVFTTEELWKPFRYWQRIDVGLGLLQWHWGKSLQLKAEFDLSSIALFMKSWCYTLMQGHGSCILSQSKQSPCLCQTDSSNPYYAYIVTRHRSAQMSYKGNRVKKH